MLENTPWSAAMTPESVAKLMADIEAEDPLDFGELSIDETDARRLMANHLCEVDCRLARHGMSSEERLEIMAAIAAHTMVENMLLNMDRLRAAEGDEFEQWRQRRGLH
jgi:L-ribulose-5-phosphate 3-epimerase UlaE